MSILDDDWEDGTAVGILPWDIPANLGGARRGSVVDYGGVEDEGGVVEDEDPKPPRDGSMIYGDMMNGLIVAAAAGDKVHFAVAISVTLNLSGTPVISQVTGPGAAAVSDSLQITQAVTGDVTITWATGTFPPSILGPIATPNDFTSTTASGIEAGLVNSGDSIRVRTFKDGALAYRPFTVLVW